MLTFQPSEDNRLKQLLNGAGEGAGLLAGTLRKLSQAAEEAAKLAEHNAALKAKLSSEESARESVRKDLERSSAQAAKLDRENTLLRKELEEAHRTNFILNSDRQDLEEKLQLQTQENERNKMLRQIRSAINSEGSEIVEERRRYLARGELSEGLDYFYMMAMSTRLDLKQTRKDITFLNEQIKALSYEASTAKSETDRVRIMMHKAKDESEKLRAKAEAYKAKCAALLTKVKEFSKDDKLIAEMDEASLKIDMGSKLTKKPSAVMEPTPQERAKEEKPKS